MIEVYITVSGSGEIITWEKVASLEEAKKSVVRLDKAWLDWCEAGFPDDPVPHAAVVGYEGCDIYAKDLDSGESYWWTEDEEWAFP